MDSVSEKEQIGQLLDEFMAGRGTPLLPAVPEDMQVKGEVDPDDSDWFVWRMLPSTVSEKDLAKLAAKLPAPLPPFYKSFLASRFVLDLDQGDYTLPSLPSDKPLYEVASLLRQDFAHGAGFMQFGQARGCGDPLCFDIQRPTPDGDYPVVVFNHDVVPRQAWSNRQMLMPYAGEVAPSFRDFLPKFLSGDESIFPPPKSAEEIRRDAAWEEVAALCKAKGLDPHYRPPGVSRSDPWAIAKFLRG
jgi:hypothetical protein